MASAIAYSTVRDPRYLSDGSGRIVCFVQFSHLSDEVEFVADPNDVEPHGREIYMRSARGIFGVVGEPSPEKDRGLPALPPGAHAMPIGSILPSSGSPSLPHWPEIAPFINELNRETASGSDRGIVLTCSAMLYELLARLLLAFFVDDPAATRIVRDNNGALGTFSARIETAYALGLISQDLRTRLNIVRRIRNEFAHSFAATFNDQSIADRTTKLTADADEHIRALPRRSQFLQLRSRSCFAFTA